MPGYWLTVATIDTIGRKPIQIFGFFFLTIIFAVIGFAYEHLSEGALLGLYILAQLFFNFGPNTTTFIIPGECFPTRYRSTGHGVSAAAGKIGAIIAQILIQFLLNKGALPDCSGKACSPFLNHLMQIFALFMLCGTMVSFLVPETKGRTLEELAGEGNTVLDIRVNGNSSSSVNDGDGWGAWFARNNPFSGGAPAGFNYVKSPNLGPRSPGIRGKRERMGIMMSPELIPKKKRKGEKEKDASSQGSGSHAGSGRHGHSLSVERQEDNDDLYLAGAGGALPGWGAGWGVQRNPGGRRDERAESVMLQDVGRLLR